MSKKKKVTVTVDSKLYREFRIMCINRGVSVAQLVAEMMKDVVEWWKKESQPKSVKVSSAKTQLPDDDDDVVKI